MLAWATVIETDTPARSGFLTSLATLALAGRVPTAVLQLVISRLSRGSLEGHDVHIYDTLAATFDEQRNSTLRIRPRPARHHSDGTRGRRDAQ